MYRRLEDGPTQQSVIGVISGQQSIPNALKTSTTLVVTKSWWRHFVLLSVFCSDLFVFFLPIFSLPFVSQQQFYRCLSHTKHSNKNLNETEIFLRKRKFDKRLLICYGNYLFLKWIDILMNTSNVFWYLTERPRFNRVRRRRRQVQRKIKNDCVISQKLRNFGLELKRRKESSLGAAETLRRQLIFN